MRTKPLLVPVLALLAALTAGCEKTYLYHPPRVAPPLPVGADDVELARCPYPACRLTRGRDGAYYLWDSRTHHILQDQRSSRLELAEFRRAMAPVLRIDPDSRRVTDRLDLTAGRPSIAAIKAHHQSLGLGSATLAGAERSRTTYRTDTGDLAGSTNRCLPWRAHTDPRGAADGVRLPGGTYRLAEAARVMDCVALAEGAWVLVKRPGMINLQVAVPDGGRVRLGRTLWSVKVPEETIPPSFLDALSPAVAQGSDSYYVHRGILNSFADQGFVQLAVNVLDVRDRDQPRVWTMPALQRLDAYSTGHGAYVLLDLAGRVILQASDMGLPPVGRGFAWTPNLNLALLTRRGNALTYESVVLDPRTGRVEDFVGHYVLSTRDSLIVHDGTHRVFYRMPLD
ncbi:hypothetical protein [Roseospirillum parvum]|uniref:Uncharacterized protein n=1 Tax=Roseospirillum parvum TaxID=83401 RepID=A0A1G7V2F7_9PROT|nr:hypothetical protein [Roseospirillum parvum]SDG54002.1 hypothetical protein SAMN05421742_101517 [Roseospirillum parvum]